MDTKVSSGGAIKKALIINSQKWNSVLKNLNRNEEVQKKTEEEKAFNDYLKKGSEEIKSKWPTKIVKKTPEAKIQDQKQKAEEKASEDVKQFKELQKIKDEIRQEKITKARKLLMEMKPETRELYSAAMCSEVIKGREIQKSIKENFEKSLKENEKREEEKYQIQTDNWIKDQQEKAMETKKRNEKYRNELQQQITNENRKKAEFAKCTLMSEQQKREQAEREMKEQIEREKIILERKKEAMRKSALEAMRMMEQRRLREQMEATIQEEIVNVFNEGKNNIANIKKEKERLAQEERIKRIEENSQKMLDNKARSEEEEEARRKQAIQEFYAKLDDREKERIEKAKRRKAERIQMYLEEMERQKREKIKEEEEKKWEVANRMKNEEVDKEYYRLQAEEKKSKAIELRTVLFDQMQEKKLQELQKKEIEQKLCTDGMNDKNGAIFMNCAKELIQNANQKGQPVWPILKVVEQYKGGRSRTAMAQRMVKEHHNPKVNNSNSNKKNGCNCKPTNQPIIKYGLDELKQLNPSNYPRVSLWA